MHSLNTLIFNITIIGIKIGARGDRKNNKNIKKGYSELSDKDIFLINDSLKAKLSYVCIIIFEIKLNFKSFKKRSSVFSITRCKGYSSLLLTLYVN